MMRLKISTGRLRSRDSPRHGVFDGRDEAFLTVDKRDGTVGIVEPREGYEEIATDRILRWCVEKMKLSSKTQGAI